MSGDYETERAGENRAPCNRCGTTDAACTARILAGKAACCGPCYATDTHPPTPRDAGPALDPRAVEAAAEALWTDGRLSRKNREAVRYARLAVTAAAPFLRAEGAAAERQRIAAAIRANHQRAYHLDSTAGPLCICGRLDPCPDAALAVRIAEADPGTTAPTEEAP